MKKTNLNKYLGIALIIAVIVFLALWLPGKLSKEAKPEEKPLPKREVQLIVLKADCEDCFNISLATEFIKNFPTLNVTGVEELEFNQSIELALKYNLTRLPSMLVKGNITNLTIPNFASAEDALVLAQTPPPYYDIEEEKVKGRVSLIMLEAPKCSECFNMSLLVDQLKNFGIAITSSKTLDYASVEGRELVEKYKIEKVPTLLFNKEILAYEMIANVWEKVGSEEKDGTLVLRQVSPPYLNVSTGNVEGLVKLTILADESCTECYNASLHKLILERNFGMKFAEEKTEDINSSKGKALVKKYGIELVPTIILSKEASAYQSFAEAWNQVGSIEKDGSFVFRKIDLLSNIVYKNLTSGETINTSVQPEKKVEEQETEEADAGEAETEEAGTE